MAEEQQNDDFVRVRIHGFDQLSVSTGKRETVTKLDWSSLCRIRPEMSEFLFVQHNDY